MVQALNTRLFGTATNPACAPDVLRPRHERLLSRMKGVPGRAVLASEVVLEHAAKEGGDWLGWICGLSLVGTRRRRGDFRVA